MDSEQPVAKPQHDQASPHMRPVYAGDYPSNPFKTAVTGIKAFWENGKGILAGILGLEFLLLLAVWLVAVLTVVLGVVLLLSSVANSSLPSEIANVIPPSLKATSGGLANAGPASGLILLICLVLLCLTAVFMQAVQTSFVGKTVALRQKPAFGDVIKMAFQRMWALLGQSLLIGLIVGGAMLVVGMLVATLVAADAIFIVLGILLYIALAVAGIYFFARIAFAGLGVVIHSQGPWQAIKHSFEITKGHVGEVIGIGAVAFTVAMVVGFITNLLQYLAVSVNMPVFSIVIIIVIVLLSMIFGFVFMAIMTERYAQLTSLAQTKIAHKTEWGSIVGSIAAAVLALIIIGMMQYAILPTAPQKLNPDIYLDDPNQLQDIPSFDQYDPNMTEEELQKWLNSVQDPTTGDALYQ